MTAFLRLVLFIDIFLCNYTAAAATEGQSMCRDDIKRRNNANGVIEDLIGNLKLGLQFVYNHPALWGDERMKECVNLANKITSDPEKYRPPVELRDWGVTIDDLTKNVSDRLDQRELPVMQPSEEKLYLLIATTTQKSNHKQIGDGNVAIDYRTWRILAADGDGKGVHVRLDSTLSTEGNLLIPGTIILVKKFLPVYYQYENQDDNRVAMVVKEFEIAGRRQLPPDLLAGMKESNVVKPPRKVTQQIKKSKGKAHPTEEDATHCKCTGNLCSMHGVDFVVCLTECQPVHKVSLPLVARGCVFATREIGEMSQSDKRFLLYYYYATTVYQFHGKGNRVQLPECLKKAVRDLYPDEELEFNNNEESDDN